MELYGSIHFFFLLWLSRALKRDGSINHGYAAAPKMDRRVVHGNAHVTVSAYTSALASHVTTGTARGTQEDRDCTIAATAHGIFGNAMRRRKGTHFGLVGRSPEYR